ncbi:MAG: class I SAM-dependent methyltransferase [Burkholderiaceae bacterium]|nr:class I SAM-dependent methyltransferase [Burkholderiaceae bacterium]
MASRFTDHFGSVASTYADSRPSYPQALFDWLAEQCARRELAWDCGAGSGQASVALASRFARVIATDASAKQIARAIPHARVEYRVAVAEQSGLDAGCVDLIVVAQALHWFDLGRFWPEVRRVARRGAVFAAWTYGPLHVEGNEVDALVQRFRAQIAPWWPEERRHVENGYRDIALPFPRLEAPPLAIDARWDVDRLLGYLRSWSSVVRMRQARGVDPVQALEAPMRAAWGATVGERVIRWPLTLLAGFVDAGG